MDILIKNIERPKEGYTEIRLYNDGSVLYKTKDNIYQNYADIQFKEAKAIELPSYIELKNMFNARYDYFKTEGFNHPEREAFDQILCDLKIAPSVLEASNG